MSSLVLLANARLPSQRAQSLQVVQAACAVARAGAPTTLLHAKRRQTPELPPRQDLYSYYAVPPGERAEIVAVDCVDWIDLAPRALQYGPARLQELTFARRAAEWVLAQRPRPRVLSREVEAARDLLRKGHPGLFLEIHRVPGGSLRRKWLLETASGVRGLVAISGGVREDLLELGIDAQKVVVEHDAMEPSRFAQIPSREQARSELALPRDVPLVAYTGGLLAWKGVDVLLGAARKLPDVGFVIAGGMTADVERLCSTAAELVNVRLDGFQPPERVALYLAAADVLAVPNRSQPAISSRYTSPLKVFEAMAVGRTVVASDLPSLRELLTHDRDAWLVQPDDPDALAEGLRRVLGDDALRARLATTLHERAPAHTWDARAERLLAWFEEAA